MASLQTTAREGALRIARMTPITSDTGRVKLAWLCALKLKPPNTMPMSTPERVCKSAPLQIMGHSAIQSSGGALKSVPALSSQIIPQVCAWSSAPQIQTISANSPIRNASFSAVIQLTVSSILPIMRPGPVFRNALRDPLLTTQPIDALRSAQSMNSTMETLPLISVSRNAPVSLPYSPTT